MSTLCPIPSLLSSYIIYGNALARRPSKELLAFTELGRSAEGDRLRVMKPSGAIIRFSIPPLEGTTFQSGSSSSLSGTWVVLTHNIKVMTADRLYRYSRASSALDLLPTGDGAAGRGVISPSERYMVYSHAPPDHHSMYALWIMDLRTHQVRQVSHVLMGTWDSVPSWSPDEKKLAFIRFNKAPQGLVPTPMLIDLDSDSTREILPEGEGAFGVAFGATNSHVAILTKNGVEILDLTSGDRTIVLPTSALEGRGFRLGGISMSKRSGLIAISTFDRKAWRSELLLISSNTKIAPKSIYSVRNATIENPSFIENK